MPGRGTPNGVRIGGTLTRQERLSPGARRDYFFLSVVVVFCVVVGSSGFAGVCVVSVVVVFSVV